MSSHNDEVAALKARVSELEKRNEELDSFAQACLTKIGNMNILLGEAHAAISGNADLAERIRKELG